LPVSSSPSSSDNESSANSSPRLKPASNQARSAEYQDDSEDEDASSLTSQPIFPAPAIKPAPKIDSQQNFEAFYLKQATREFAEDLDRLRNASDFRAEEGKGVALLVEALRQGTACFSGEERRRVGGAQSGN
jgi:ribosome assembly protein 3